MLAKHLVQLLNSAFVVTYVTGIYTVCLFECADLRIEVVDYLLLAFVLVRQFTSGNLYLTQFVFLNGKLRGHTFEGVLVGLLRYDSILHLTRQLAVLLLVCFQRLAGGGQFTTPAIHARSGSLELLA